MTNSAWGSLIHVFNFVYLNIISHLVTDCNVNPAFTVTEVGLRALTSAGYNVGLQELLPQAQEVMFSITTMRRERIKNENQRLLYA